MTIDPIWFQVGTALIVLLLAIIGVILRLGLTAGIKRLGVIETAIHQVGERMTKSEEWQRNHDQRDNDRFMDIRNDLRELREARR